MIVNKYLKTNKDSASQFEIGLSFSAELFDNYVEVYCESHLAKRFAVYVNKQYRTATTSYKKAVGMAVLILQEYGN